jgi:hypothetical protein
MKSKAISVLSLLMAMVIGLTASILPNSASALLTTSLSLDKEAVDVKSSESITATWQTTGGIGPINYYHIWYIRNETDGNWDSVQEDISESNHSTFTPTYGKRGYIWVQSQSKDGEVHETGKEFSITGGNALEALMLSVTIPLGEIRFDDPQMSIPYFITGGLPPYTLGYSFDYELEYVTSGHSSSSIEVEASSELSMDDLLIPKYFDSGNLTIWASDATDQRSNSIHQHLTLKDQNPLSVSISLDKAIASPGSMLSISWQIKGGEPPYQSSIFNQYASVATNAVAMDPELPVEGTSVVIPISTDVMADSFMHFWMHVKDSRGRLRGAFVRVPTAHEEPAEKEMPGDATGDGVIDIMDLVAVIDRIISGIVPKNLENADAKRR